MRNCIRHVSWPCTPVWTNVCPTRTCWTMPCSGQPVTSRSRLALASRALSASIHPPLPSPSQLRGESFSQGLASQIQTNPSGGRSPTAPLARPPHSSPYDRPLHDLITGIGQASCSAQSPRLPAHLPLLSPTQASTIPPVFMEQYGGSKTSPPGKARLCTSSYCLFIPGALNFTLVVCTYFV